MDATQMNIDTILRTRESDRMQTQNGLLRSDQDKFN